MTRSVLFTAPSWRALTRASRRSLPREVGGLLLGYYTDQGPLVITAPVVPDPRSTRIRYRRDADAAKRILEKAIADDCSEKTGYLGEWHSHPLPIGPSRTDIGSVHALAAAGGHDVTLVVLALGPSGWIAHARHVSPQGVEQVVSVSVEGEHS